MPMTIMGLVKNFQNWVHKPAGNLNTPDNEKSRKGKIVKSGVHLSETNPITQRKIRSNTGIKYMVARALGLTISKKDALLQEKVKTSVAEIRAGIDTPDALLEKYPQMAEGHVIYALAQPGPKQEEIKALCKARLNKLKKHFSRYPIITFLQERVRWTIRKVAALFSKDIATTIQQEIKDLKKELRTFEKDPVAFIKKLDKFERDNRIFSLTETLDVQLYFPPEQAKSIQPLLIQTKNWVNTPEIEKLKLEQNKLKNVSIKKLKSTLIVGKEKLRQFLPATPKEKQNTDVSDNFNGTELPTLFAEVDVDKDIKDQLDHWRADAQATGIPYLSYINLHPCGLMGRLYDEKPVLAHELLKKTIKKPQT